MNAHSHSLAVLCMCWYVLKLAAPLSIQTYMLSVGHNQYSGATETVANRDNDTADIYSYERAKRIRRWPESTTNTQERKKEIKSREEKDGWKPENKSYFFGVRLFIVDALSLSIVRDVQVEDEFSLHVAIINFCQLNMLDYWFKLCCYACFIAVLRHFSLLNHFFFQILFK